MLFYKIYKLLNLLTKILASLLKSNGSMAVGLTAIETFINDNGFMKSNLSTILYAEQA